MNYINLIFYYGGICVGGKIYGFFICRVLLLGDWNIRGNVEGINFE